MSVEERIKIIESTWPPRWRLALGTLLLSPVLVALGLTEKGHAILFMSTVVGGMMIAIIITVLGIVFIISGIEAWWKGWGKV